MICAWIWIYLVLENSMDRLWMNNMHTSFSLHKTIVWLQKTWNKLYRLLLLYYCILLKNSKLKINLMVTSILLSLFSVPYKNGSHTGPVEGGQIMTFLDWFKYIDNADVQCFSLSCICLFQQRSTVASMMHRQETVECLRKFNARRKLKVQHGFEGPLD